MSIYIRVHWLYIVWILTNAENYVSTTLVSHRIVSLPETSSVLHLLIPPPRSWKTNPLIVSVVSLFQSVIWLESYSSGAFSDWILSLSIMHLRFLHVLLGPESCFLLVLNNILLSGYTTLYPFTHWRTSWMLTYFGNCE